LIPCLFPQTLDISFRPHPTTYATTEWKFHEGRNLLQISYNESYSESPRRNDSSRPKKEIIKNRLPGPDPQFYHLPAVHLCIRYSDSLCTLFLQFLTFPIYLLGLWRGSSELRYINASNTTLTYDT
jgi:hypothetical protein